MTFVASPRIRSVGCMYADRCAYAPDAAVSTHMCLYAVVAWWVHIRGLVRLRERVGVRIYTRRGCVYAPPRVYTGFCVYAPPTAYTQDSTIRRTVMVDAGRPLTPAVGARCTYDGGCR